MHPFFLVNYKSCNYYAKYSHTIRALPLLGFEKEKEWVNHSFQDFEYGHNFKVFSFFREFYHSSVTFDLNVAGLIKSTLEMAFQENFNKLEEKVHLGLKWVFSSSELMYHKLQSYKITMGKNLMSKFYLMDLQYTNLTSYFEYMLSTLDLVILYYKEIAIKEEIFFLNLINEKRIVPYYFFLDFLNYSKILYFKKLNEGTSFFYRMCYYIIFKIKKRVILGLSEAVNFMDERKNKDSLTFLNTLEDLFSFKSNLVLFHEVTFNSNFGFITKFYNSLSYYNWRAEQPKVAVFSYSKSSFTYSLFKVSFDSLFFNRYQNLFSCWRVFMGKLQQN
jgi:hypothetical protein